MDFAKDPEKIKYFSETILSSMDEWVRIVDSHHNVIFANKAMQTALGNITGTKCYEFWEGTIPCKECVSALARQEISAGQREVKRQGRYYKIQCYPIVMPEGTCDETIEIITDISDQKELVQYQKSYAEKLKKDVATKTAQIRKNQDIIFRERKNLETILESMQDYVFVIDKDYTIQFMNRILVKIYGNMIGKKCYKLLHGKDKPCQWCLSQRVFDEKKTLRWNYRSDKNKHIYDVIESPMLNPDGTVTALVTMRDITEMKQIEEKLRQSEERFSLSQQVANLGSWDWDIQTGILHWSERIEPMFGFEKGKFGGTYGAFLDCVHPDDRQQVIDAVNDCVEDDRNYAIEHRIVWPDSTVRWVSDTGNVIRDKNGKAFRMLGIVADITERKQVEIELQLNESRLEALLKLSNMTEASEGKITSFALEEGVRLTSSKIGYMHFINDDQISLQLYSWSKSVLKDCRANKTPHYPLEDSGVWTDCVRRRKPVIHNEYQNLKGKKGYPEGHVHLIRHMSVPVFDEDKIVAVAGVGNKKDPYDESDIRQLSLLMTAMWEHLRHRRAMEEIKSYSQSLEEKVRNLVDEVRTKDRLALLGEISAGLAHEIRNPLGSLVAGIKLLGRGGKSENEKQTIFEVLKKESERLNNALDEFLDYARPRKLQKSDVDINQILVEIVKLTQQDPALINGHAIKINFDSELPHVSVDRDRVKQVFWNIVINGMKSMENKGTLSVKTISIDKWIQVEISDTGKGIAPENKNKIFTPFFTMRKGGTGLGLSIAQRIMEEHKGKIEVESAEGKGTVFTINFPLTVSK
jgi:PAS domain S-box-containing protein